jgi:hypothetical protein
MMSPVKSILILVWIALRASIWLRERRGHMIHARCKNKYRLDMQVSPTPMAGPDQAIGASTMRASLLAFWKLNQSVRRRHRACDGAGDSTFFPAELPASRIR